MSPEYWRAHSSKEHPYLAPLCPAMLGSAHQAKEVLGGQEGREPEQASLPSPPPHKDLRGTCLLCSFECIHWQGASHTPHPPKAVICGPILFPMGSLWLCNAAPRPQAPCTAWLGSNPSPAMPWLPPSFPPYGAHNTPLQQTDLWELLSKLPGTPCLTTLLPSPLQTATLQKSKIHAFF